MSEQAVIGEMRQSQACAIAAVLAGYTDDNPYMEFDTDTMQGLARIIDGGIEILAILSKREGAGNFRRFIEDLKANYASIAVWEIWKPWLGPVLERYGFKPARKTERDGERISGFKWIRPHLQDKP